MAMMLAKRQKPGKWVVTKFGKKHNHPMVVNSNKEQPTPDEEDKKIQELSVELNRANRRVRHQTLLFFCYSNPMGGRKLSFDVLSGINDFIDEEEIIIHRSISDSFQTNINGQDNSSNNKPNKRKRKPKG
ncbi:hypothetical protein IFM89_039011 [Coptis chinensis]|uniref:Uncharacterized protein n=1 Tax=Coptis chinensis TaxID=261450 RepID=A0A835M8M9_9MAGN|nr:hypothetical protein IFM89_039011 [Coptis chinensis]